MGLAESAARTRNPNPRPAQRKREDSVEAGFIQHGTADSEAGAQDEGETLHRPHVSEGQTIAADGSLGP
jgi:hypothetical protein